MVYQRTQSIREGMREAQNYLVKYNILKGVVTEFSREYEKWQKTNGVFWNEVTFEGRYGKTAKLRIKVNPKNHYHVDIDELGTGWLDSNSFFVSCVGNPKAGPFKALVTVGYPSSDELSTLDVFDSFWNSRLNIFEIAIDPKTMKVMWIWNHIGGFIDDRYIAFEKGSDSLIGIGNKLPIVLQDLHTTKSSNLDLLIAHTMDTVQQIGERNDIWEKIISFLKERYWIDEDKRASLHARFQWHSAFFHEGHLYSVQDYRGYLLPHKGIVIPRKNVREISDGERLLAELYSTGILARWLRFLEAQEEDYTVIVRDLVHDIERVRTQILKQNNLRIPQEIQIEFKGTKYSFSAGGRYIKNFRIGDENSSITVSKLELGADILRGILEEIMNARYKMIPLIDFTLSND